MIEKCKGIFPGTWDLLHCGHVVALEKAKERCDYLIAALKIDPTSDNDNKNKPIQTAWERFKQLQACRFVDEVLPYETENDLRNMYVSISFSKLFVGGDWGKPMENGSRDLSRITGLDILNKKGIMVEVIDREHTYSTSELRNRILCESYRKAPKSQFFNTIDPSRTTNVLY